MTARHADDTMTVQTVRPAGAGHETIAVLAGCALILAVAGTVVSLRAAPEQTHGVAAHQIDARRDLNAAEQGVYADLRVALDEIEAAGEPPLVTMLAEMALPPFAQDASSRQRGAHVWQLLQRGDTSAYAGLSADVQTAGSLLVRLPQPHAHGHATSAAHADAEPDVWLHRGADVALPTALDDASLTRSGWKQIAARFDAGVTRQRK
jgi:hypothetical protein